MMNAILRASAPLYIMVAVIAGGAYAVQTFDITKSDITSLVRTAHGNTALGATNGMIIGDAVRRAFE
jgi:hypothetical protein